MAAGARYLRYIIIAFVALVFVLFLSSSGSSSHIKSATDKLKTQSQDIWRQSGLSGTGYTTGQPSNAAPVTDAKLAEGEAIIGNDPLLSPAMTTHLPASQHTSTPIDHHDTSPNPHSTRPSTGLATSMSARMNATFVTLARNSDVWEISRSIRQVEDRFNHNYNYDWVFLNDAEFDDQFRNITTALTSGRARYGKIGKDHWGYPSYIDQEKARRTREDMKQRQIIYGDSVSYRHMCRYESGFFFQHPLMLEYEWYWRVEPSVELYCDVAYDPFVFMAKNNKKYSFTISLREYAETIPTLWDSTVKFLHAHPEHVASDNAMDFLSDDGGESYNYCHFWSNFEIGSLTWLRSKAYTEYFDFLDHEGGFFYERWGDAPVHSIAAGLFLNKSEIHFFNDIAYYHVPFTHCPKDQQTRVDLKCHCDPNENFDWNGYSCTKQWFNTAGMPLPADYEET